MRLSCGIEVRTVIEFSFLYKNSASSCIITEIALISGGYGSVTNKMFNLSSRIMLKWTPGHGQFLRGLKEYFEFYNFERRHQSLVGKTPAKIYWGKEVAKKAA